MIERNQHFSWYNFNVTSLSSTSESTWVKVYVIARQSSRWAKHLRPISRYWIKACHIVNDGVIRYMNATELIRDRSLKLSFINRDQHTLGASVSFSLPLIHLHLFVHRASMLWFNHTVDVDKYSTKRRENIYYLINCSYFTNKRLNQGWCCRCRCCSTLRNPVYISLIFSVFRGMCL